MQIEIHTSTSNNSIRISDHENGNLSLYVALVLGKHLWKPTTPYPGPALRDPIQSSNPGRASAQLCLQSGSLGQMPCQESDANL